ncbi:MAG: hypothetical protein JO360_13490 [Acidobacteria bacterium]|nr:hypothetical protein [Acidobacteriota bacterium]
MSELTDQHWAVISERGVESSGLSYQDALQLMRRLESQKVHGLCIVTDAAAERDAHATVHKGR